jgi:hypothetical protein
VTSLCANTFKLQAVVQCIPDPCDIPIPTWQLPVIYLEPIPLSLWHTGAPLNDGNIFLALQSFIPSFKSLASVVPMAWTWTNRVNWLLRRSDTDLVSHLQNHTKFQHAHTIRYFYKICKETMSSNIHHLANCNSSYKLVTPPNNNNIFGGITTLHTTIIHMQ